MQEQSCEAKQNSTFSWCVDLVSQSCLSANFADVALVFIGQGEEAWVLFASTYGRSETEWLSFNTVGLF